MGGSGGYRRLPGGSDHFSWQTDRQTDTSPLYIYHHHHRQSTHKSKQKCHLNDANVKIHHKRVDFSGLPILPEPPRDVEQDRLEEEINIFVNLYSILTGISHEMPRTPSIVTDNKSSSLVWFKWGSQWWGIVKHFPQSRCILISHWAIEK